jgi:hypothetical protein
VPRVERMAQLVPDRETLAPRIAAAVDQNHAIGFVGQGDQPALETRRRVMRYPCERVV